jgi:hypothetical protein
VDLAQRSIVTWPDKDVGLSFWVIGRILVLSNEETTMEPIIAMLIAVTFLWFVAISLAVSTLVFGAVIKTCELIIQAVRV